MTRSRRAWLLAVLTASVCVAIAAGLWTAALRATHQNVDAQELCEDFDRFRVALASEGIAVDTAIRARTVELADAATHYPDTAVAESGEELLDILSMPDGTAADLLAATPPIAAVCGTR